MSRKEATQRVVQLEMENMSFLLTKSAAQVDVLLAKLDALKCVSSDGNTVLCGSDKKLLPEHMHLASMYDTQFPPGTAIRAFLNDHRQNVESQIRTKGTHGVRFSASTLHVTTQLIARIGKSAYEELAQIMPALPSYSYLSRFKNFIPSSEEGPLASNIRATRYQLDAKVTEGVLSSRTNGDAVSLCNDEMTFVPKLQKGFKAGTMEGFTTIEAGGLTAQELSTHFEERVAAGMSDAADLQLMYKDVESQLADTYHVFYATFLSEPEPKSFLAGRYFTKGTTSADLALMQHDVIVSLEDYLFNVLCLIQDGASTNRSFYTDYGVITAERWFTEEKMAEFPLFDWDTPVAMKHPLFKDRVIFLLDDPPHWMKKMRNHLHASNHLRFTERGVPHVPAPGDRVTAPRHLKMLKRGAKCGTPKGKWWVMNLIMIQRGVGLLPGVEPNFSSASELQRAPGVTQADYILKTAADKMNVKRAFGPFRKVTHDLIEANKHLIDFVNDGALPAHGEYKGVSLYCQHVREMFHIFNSAERDEPWCAFHTKRGSVLDVKSPILAELLAHLNFFTKWRHDLLSTDVGLSADEVAKSFLSPETWQETKGLCLGLVCFAKEFVGAGRRLDKMIFRRFNQGAVLYFVSFAVIPSHTVFVCGA